MSTGGQNQSVGGSFSILICAFWLERGRETSVPVKGERQLLLISDTREEDNGRVKGHFLCIWYVLDALYLCFYMNLDFFKLTCKPYGINFT